MRPNQLRVIVGWLFTLVTLIIASSVLAEEAEPYFDWKLETVENGLIIYTAEQHNTGLVPIRFITILDYPPSMVLTVLADTDRRAEWMPNLIEASIVDRIGIDQKIEFLRYHFPWPFSDRTFLIDTLNTYDFNDKRIVFETRSVSLPEIPETGKYVRAETLLGTMVVNPRDSGQKTYLEATYLTDMKGFIPKWLINQIQKKWPRKLISALNQQLSKHDIRVQERWVSWDVE